MGMLCNGSFFVRVEMGKMDVLRDGLQVVVSLI